MARRKSEKLRALPAGAIKRSAGTSSSKYDTQAYLYIAHTLAKALDEFAGKVEKFWRQIVKRNYTVRIDRVSIFYPDENHWAFDGYRMFFSVKLWSSCGFIGTDTAYADLTIDKLEREPFEIEKEVERVLGRSIGLQHFANEFTDALSKQLGVPLSDSRLWWEAVEKSAAELPTQPLLLAEFTIQLGTKKGRLFFAIPVRFVAALRQFIPKDIDLMEAGVYRTFWFSDGVRYLTLEVVKTLLDNFVKNVRGENTNPGAAIRSSKTESAFAKSLDARWEKLDEFARLNPGKPVSLLGKKLFLRREAKQIKLPSLPAKAPELWPSDSSKRTETPAQFATRVYRVWMDAEVLTRSILEELDPLLLSSLDNWLQNNRRKPRPEPLPEGFRLLTVGQANDLWIDRVKTGEAPFPSEGPELNRFVSALKNRLTAGSKQNTGK